MRKINVLVILGVREGGLIEYLMASPASRVTRTKPAVTTEMTILIGTLKGQVRQKENRGGSGIAKMRDAPGKS